MAARKSSAEPLRPTPVPNGRSKQWMSRDELVPVLPLPLSTFEWLWGIAEAKLAVAEGHTYSAEYKAMVEAAALWGRETAIEVLGREPPKKPVPKARRVKKAAPAPEPERTRPRVRLVRKKK